MEKSRQEEWSMTVYKQILKTITPLDEMILMMPTASAIICAEETVPIVTANAKFYSLFNSSPEQEISYLNADSADRLRISKRFRHFAQDKKSFETEFHIGEDSTEGKWIKLQASYYASIHTMDLFLCCFHDVTAEHSGSYEQERDSIKIQENVLYDSLTGVWNLEHFFDVVNQRLLESNEMFQMIALDLDKFKYINEYYGRASGDMVLKVIAARLLNVFGESAAIARSYADEFYICIQKETITKEEIDALVYAQIQLENGEAVKVSIKLGIFSYDAGSKIYTGHECMDRALMACEKIKESHGRNYMIYTTEMEEKMHRENEMEDVMEQALEQGEFVVYYQPKFSLETEKLVGAEALVRWNSPTKGMVSPGIFIPLFEKNGFIVKLDFYVYEEVCKFLRGLLDQGYDVVPISVNVSRVHIETTDFVEKLLHVVNKYKIPYKFFEIEMTESAYGVENENVIQVVNQLKSYGFPLSMDDFGSGYSSLNLLKNMPIDVLKIDKEFLGETETSKRSREIIRMIVEMSKAIDIQTICEGVETNQQAEFLKNIGCDMVQGFLYARPMPEENYIEELQKYKTAQI